MQENAVSDKVQLGLTTEHIGRKHNLADPFTKAEKNDDHFITCRNLLITKIQSLDSTSYQHLTKENETITIANQPTITNPNGQNDSVI